MPQSLTTYNFQKSVLNPHLSSKTHLSASRYGFNGKMKDNEVEGEGDIYDFSARMYDARLGRWLSVDPLQVKYANYSPYNFSENNPIYFNDKDGKDAVGKVEGNTITYSTTILIYGEGATKEKALEIEKAASKYFVDTKVIAQDGKEYNVKFNISVKVLNSETASTYGKSSSTNIVKLSDKVPNNRSKVTDFFLGLWSSKDKSNIIAHEVGHFFGLGDQYIELSPRYDVGNNAMLNLTPHVENLPGVDDNELMGVAAQKSDAKVSSSDVKAMANFVLKTKNKNGEATITIETLGSNGLGKGLGKPDTEIEAIQSAGERQYDVKQDLQITKTNK